MSVGLHQIAGVKQQIILDRQNARHILGSQKGIGAVWIETTGYPLSAGMASDPVIPKCPQSPYADHLPACILPVKDEAATR